MVEISKQRLYVRGLNILANQFWYLTFDFQLGLYMLQDSPFCKVVDRFHYTVVHCRGKDKGKICEVEKKSRHFPLKGLWDRNSAFDQRCLIQRLSITLSFGFQGINHWDMHKSSLPTLFPLTFIFEFKNFTVAGVLPKLNSWSSPETTMYPGHWDETDYHHSVRIRKVVMQVGSQQRLRSIWLTVEKLGVAGLQKKKKDL
jgi:hypothetical protein